MTDYTKMIERLRSGYQGIQLGAVGMGWDFDAKTIIEAADAIEALQGENERLKRDVACHDDMSNEIAYLRKERDALAAELAGLKSQNQLEDFSFMDAEDAIFEQIHVAARKSFQRHKSAVRGQQFTRADGIDSHLIWAAIEWAKTSAPKALEPLTDEQIWELAANCLDGHFGRLNFARAIEAAHGITKGTP